MSRFFDSASRGGAAVGAAPVPRRPDPLDDALAAPVASGDVPGLAWTVWREGATRSGAAGVQDLASCAPMRRDTLFRVASLTKPVTAVAAMILVEEGFLELDAPIDPWLPELRDRRVVRRLDGPLDDTVPAARPITPRDLLTMRIGLGAVFADPAASPLLTRMGELGLAPGPGLFDGDADDYLERLASLPLACQPGRRWLYHTGMDVLGLLVSRVTGMRLGDFMHERVFEPLGMRDTGFHVPKENLGRLATCYERDGNGALVPCPELLGPDPSVPPRLELGGSGLVSTVDDFAAFGRMLLAGGAVDGRRIISPESVSMMTTDQVPAEVKAVSPFYPGFWDTYGWGLGMAVVTAPDGIPPAPGRFGWWGGTGTTFFCDPATGTVAVLMFQRMMTRPDDTETGEAFLKLALAGPGGHAATGRGRDWKDR
ncbi:serine hydrolase domain-containing protein [Lutibaculum baratangense]|uniref:Beta-lactamase class C and other penicillin binding protein n=1 Tax=Lutibaculum baratangense AMV1 TaxID=631454 RepID=V4RJS6_9HYPH|nr:hydrolase [Lutibaculum baratangense]ESR25579.1 Beta-lactamase class C and other penicillin binding protein [Lutibaculum baratangense AMV1]